VVERHTVEEKRQAYNDYLLGMPIKQLAQRYGVTQQTIRNWITKIDKAA
jgi:uncharacterized protein YjcR